MYTNAEPHIGFALELLQADALARWHRAKGEEVYFLTGTDEHGAKVQASAEKAGEEPPAFVDKIAGKVEELTKVLDISNDDFIRTSDQKKHWPGATRMWQTLKEKGYLEKRKYEGLYCEGCEAFISEKDCTDGKCQVHNVEPKKVSEENWFFKLSDFGEEIGKKIESDELKIIPENRKKEILNVIKSGLQDISFSRPREKVSWGIPVPDDDSQTMYVWSDALVNYMSALGYGSDDMKKFEKFWPADVHVVGKDILRFHAAIWPGMLLAAGLPLPKSILVHGFVNVDGQKMSKSLGNVVDPLALVEKYGLDPVRYYLLSQIPTIDDGDFTIERFEAVYNADLANDLGNLANRVSTMVANYLGGRVGDSLDPEVGEAIKRAEEGVAKAFETMQLHNGLTNIGYLTAFLNQYIDQKEPWELAKDESKKEELELALASLVIGLRGIAKMLEPFLPETAGKLAAIFNAKKIQASDPLFPRLEK